MSFQKCKLIPNWTRKTVWLVINNINMKKIAWRMFWTLRTLNSLLTQSGKKLRRNCAIQGARLIRKQKIWLAICELLCSLTNQNACFITFFCIQLPLFCTVLRKNCIVLSQSESSNFFMYIISALNSCDKRHSEKLTVKWPKFTRPHVSGFIADLFFSTLESGFIFFPDSLSNSPDACGR